MPTHEYVVPRSMPMDGPEGTSFLSAMTPGGWGNVVQ